MIGDDVRIVVVAVDRDQVKLGIEAPRDISVHRSEIYEEIQRSDQAATAVPAEAQRESGAGRATLKPRKKPPSKS
ncbi:MAG TPA: carbon storage regulator [Verrucomicrobiae bacterium]|nr:carbon storage regulator [Verrucomicrobiae bacterium]